MGAVLKQVGTISCESDMLKMSVMTLTRGLAQVLSTWPGMLSGPAALLIFTLRRILLTSTVDTDSGRSPGDGEDLTAESLSRGSKQA